MPRFLKILCLLGAVFLALPSGLASQGAQSSSSIKAAGPISISADRMTADDAKRLVTFSGRVVARQGDLVISCDTMRVTYRPAGSYAPPARKPEGAAPESPSSESPASGNDAFEGGASAAVDPPAGSSAASEGPPAGAASSAGEAPAEEASGLSSLGGGQEIDTVECEGAVKIQEGERLAVAEKALYLAKSLPRRLVLTGDARIWQGQNSVTGHQITYYLDENRSLVDSVGSQRVRAFYDQGGGKH